MNGIRIAMTGFSPTSLLDPKEEHALSYEIQDLWVRYPAGQILVDHLASFQRYPPIKPGTPDPYVPPK